MSALLYLEGKGGGGGDLVNMSTLTDFGLELKKRYRPMSVTLLEMQSLVNCMLISWTSLYTCRDKELHFKC